MILDKINRVVNPHKYVVTIKILYGMTVETQIQRLHKSNAPAVFLYSFDPIKQLGKIMSHKNTHDHKGNIIKVK